MSLKSLEDFQAQEAAEAVPAVIRLLELGVKVLALLMEEWLMGRWHDPWLQLDRAAMIQYASSMKVDVSSCCMTLIASGQVCRRC